MGKETLDVDGGKENVDGVSKGERRDIKQIVETALQAFKAAIAPLDMTPEEALKYSREIERDKNTQEKA